MKDIEVLRNKLNKAIDNKLSKNEIIKLSKKLDVVIEHVLGRGQNEKN